MNRKSKVYIFHIHSAMIRKDTLLHLNLINNLNPDYIIGWSDLEYDVEHFLNNAEFAKILTPYLEKNNKTVSIFAPGFDRKITDRILVYSGLGYYMVNMYTEKTIVNTDIDLTNIHLKADKLYTCYCYQDRYARRLMIDSLARENLINEGIVTFHGKNTGWKYYNGPDLRDEEQFEFASTINNRYPIDTWTGKNNIDLYKNEKYLRYNLVVPPSYFKGFVDIVLETYTGDLEFFVTEKTYKSIRTLKPFLTLSCQHYHKFLFETYGVEPYDEVFDYSFDSNPNLQDRIDSIIENVKMLKNKDWNEVHSMLLPKMQRNFENYKQVSYDKNKMLHSKLNFLNEVPYELHGDIYAIKDWMLLGKKNGWLK